MLTKRITATSRHTSQPLRQLLVFEAAESLYAFNVEDCNDVIKQPAICSVPCAPAGILGLANLRGMLVTVFSLNHILSQKSDISSSQVLIRLKCNTNSAFAVDQLVDLVEVKNEQIEGAPARLSNHEQTYISASTLFNGRIIFILDVTPFSRR